MGCNNLNGRLSDKQIDKLLSRTKGLVIPNRDKQFDFGLKIRKFPRSL